jgi:hypothetical protein
VREAAKRDKTSRMSRTRRRSRLAAWVTLAAIGFHALWPLLAHAGPSADPAFAEVCTTTGSKVPADSTPAPGSHANGEHCLLCPLGADRMDAIPAPLAAQWDVLPAAPAPSPEIAAPRARDSVSPAPSRAPPFPA